MEPRRGDMSGTNMTTNESIFKAMYALGNVSMSVDAIRLTADLPSKVVHDALLRLHRQGHVNGRQIQGLVIPVEKMIPTGDLFPMEKKARKGRKARSVAE